MWTGWSLLLGLAGQAAAVFRDDAGYIDGKDVFLGKPLALSEFKSRVALSSDLGVLTVLSSRGTLTWRRILEPHQLESGIGFHDDVVVIGGEYLSAYNATDGVLLWTKNHPTLDVTTSDEGILVDGKLVANADGELSATVTKELHYTPLTGTSLELSNGTLSWNELGVLNYAAKDGELHFTRDDGVGRIKQALFIKAPIQQAESFDNELFRISNEAGNDFISLVAAVSYRLKRHGRQLFDLGKFILSQGPAMLVLPEPIKDSFGFKQMIVVATEAGSVYGFSFQNDITVEWVYHDLEALDLRATEDPSTVAVISSSGETFVLTYDGDFAEERVKLSERSPGEDLVVDGNTIRSPRGWSLQLPGTEIVGQASKDLGDKTASIVAPVDKNGDVLYKYLHPYLSAFASYSPETSQLVVTVLDSVTGRIVAQTTHSEPVLINAEWPFNIVFGEHWVVYTYLSTDSSQAPKVSVLELYESGVPNERLSGSEVNVFNDTLVPFVKSRSWIMPSHQGPVYSLALSKSTFGANARDVLLGLEHQVVALPKLLLSALLPTDPHLSVPQSGHLSHVFGVSRPQKIITSHTNLESTYLIAAIGGPDFFITRSYPAGEFDRLTKSFPKVKLIIFVGLLGFATSAMAPFARLKKLKQQWR